MNKNLEFHKNNLILFGFILIFLFTLWHSLENVNFLSTQGSDALKELLKSLLHPDLSKETLFIALEATFITVVYAICGISLALLLGFTLSLFSGEVLTSNTLIIFLSDKLLTFFRGIHPLIWGVFFVSTIGLSSFSGIFAIAIAYSGAIGRVYSDHFKNCPVQPIQLMKKNGASKLTLLFYGYLPLTLPHLISYFMYRFECAIRTSIIMSFIGLGGLGYEINLALNDLYYNQMWTYILFLMGLVIIVEKWSALLRRGEKNV